jgi:hypothetical protein
MMIKGCDFHTRYQQIGRVAWMKWRSTNLGAPLSFPEGGAFSSSLNLHIHRGSSTDGCVFHFPGYHKCTRRGSDAHL